MDKTVHGLRSQSRIIGECAGAEDSFFDIDKESNTAEVLLRYDRPGDIFDQRYETKTPLMSQEFTDSIRDMLEMIPEKYKIDLTIRFSDPDGCDEQTLTEILRQNLRLEVCKASRKIHRKDIIASVLILIGAAFFAVMMLVHNVWGRDTFLNDLLFYIADLATTVTIYEALSILLLQQGEYRLDLNSLERRISSVRFELESDRETGTVTEK